MKKAIMFPPHAWHKDQKKKKDFPYIFRTEKYKKTHTLFCVSIIKYFLNLSSLPGRIITPTIFLITAKKESTFEVKIALSVQEAMDIIKQHEIENTVRFSIYSSTKEFGSTGKHFHYKVQLYILTNAFSYAETFCIDGPSSCRTIDTLSQFSVPIESLILGVLIPRSI